MNFEKNCSEYQSQINFRKSHQISWTLHDLLKSFKAKYNRRGRCGQVVLHISLTLGWLGLIKFDIKSNANLLLKAMQKHLSQPMFKPRSIFMSTYIYASADDMVGITMLNKKYWGALDVNVPFFQIKFKKTKTKCLQWMLMPRCPCWDFRMTKNEHHVCFLLKKPIRISVLGTFRTHKINSLLELWKHVPFVNKRLFIFSTVLEIW